LAVPDPKICRCPASCSGVAVRAGTQPMRTLLGSVDVCSLTVLPARLTAGWSKRSTLGERQESGWLALLDGRVAMPAVAHRCECRGFGRHPGFEPFAGGSGCSPVAGLATVHIIYLKHIPRRHQAFGHARVRPAHGHCLVSLGTPATRNVGSKR
jgi:hypothetical protein